MVIARNIEIGIKCVQIKRKIQKCKMIEMNKINKLSAYKT